MWLDTQGRFFLYSFPKIKFLSPHLTYYIRFDLGSITGRIKSAYIRLYPSGVVTRVENKAALVMNNTWEEYSITWKNRLNAGPVLETFSLEDKTPVEIYVTLAARTALRGEKSSLYASAPQWAQAARAGYTTTRASPTIKIRSWPSRLPNEKHTDEYKKSSLCMYDPFSGLPACCTP